MKLAGVGARRVFVCGLVEYELGCGKKKSCLVIGIILACTQAQTHASYLLSALCTAHRRGLSVPTRRNLAAFHQPPLEMDTIN